MNVDNAIKSLIPSAIIEDIPSEKRAHVAAKIIQFFKEQNPEFYAQLEAADDFPMEIEADVVGKIRKAALAAHNHHFEMLRQHKA